MLSMYCTQSMLPCGRYYYAPEVGYVGNPWVKFSFQYMYLYLAWIIHHLDLVEHYGVQYAQTFAKRTSFLYNKGLRNSKLNMGPYKACKGKSKQERSNLRFTSQYYDFNMSKSRRSPALLNTTTLKNVYRKVSNTGIFSKRTK
jgi:hypothetical protein